MQGFFRNTLGPGLLFAGAAVGVSHLVQATRAGAVFGLGLLGIVILANILKYPAFCFAPRYAAITGSNLLHGYRKQGSLAIFVYAVVTLATMFTVEAAVTFVTAALLKALLNIDLASTHIAAILLISCTILLAVGDYHWLDRLMKYVVALLTLCTLSATILAIPRIDWSFSALIAADIPWNRSTLLFLGPLIGWMPSAIDVSVWHSLWTVAKIGDTGHRPTVKQSLVDFNIGYIGSAMLAICFVLLGASILFGTNRTLPTSGVAFANMVIDLYTNTLGNWSRYLIGGCATMVMVSTTLTVVDGFPRALSALATITTKNHNRQVSNRYVYWLALGILTVGSLVLVYKFLRQFTTLVDIATILSFVTAPILALLNHRCIFSIHIHKSLQPSIAMRVFSLGCILAMSGTAIAWLSIRFLL